MSRIGRRISDARVRFRFDHREVEAYRGDTVASALLANGIDLFGRSIKYRRRRGVLAATHVEPNGLVTVGAGRDSIPNMPAPCVRVTESLEVRSQNRWPSLEWNLASLLRLCSRFFGAGFYYKTFMWPSWAWYEPLIRRLAGLGASPQTSTLPSVITQHLECDVVVAGGGAAGLLAALTAARAGARVVLIERDVACGGELDFEAPHIEGVAASDWIASTLAALAHLKVRVLLETTVIVDDGTLVIAQQQRNGMPGADVVFRVHARTFLRATGATEQPIAFINNDLPGVMLASAAEFYLSRYGVRVGRNVVVFGNHDRIYATASRLTNAGVRIAAVVDVRRHSPHAQRVRDLGVECFQGHAVVAAQGRRSVRGAIVAKLSEHGAPRRIECDAILVSGGWETHLATTSRAMLCGSAAGVFEINEVFAQAAACGALAAGVDQDNERVAMPSARGDPLPALEAFCVSPARERDERQQFVDLQNDVTVADLRQALVEGFCDIEHVKRYTTLGVGTEQGATSSALGARIIAHLKGSPAAPRTSRPRLPYHPVTAIALSGNHVGSDLTPVRRTPLHAWHEHNRGVMEAMGVWMRPRYYMKNGSDALQAGIVEARRARIDGGLMDASTLGKIEFNGRDAAAFLDSVYLTRASTLKVGRSKYMLNLREDGMVLDDGIVMRLAEDRFVATVSTGHADHMAAHFSFWRDRHWSDREVALTDVTEAWSVIVIAGPRSREALAKVLGPTWRQTLNTLTHMGVASGDWRDEVRLLRASFSGELAYELHCRPAHALGLWGQLIECRLQPYGIEAVDILRIEKGYLGSGELNGQTTPQDLGMGAMLSTNLACVGRALVEREAFLREDRPCLVGLKARDGRASFLAGAQLTRTEELKKSAGHVTSAAFSPALNQWIGLGLVDRRLATSGTQLLARDPMRSSETPVTVTRVTHFDPTGERLKA